MARLLFHRVVAGLVTLFIASVIVFAMIRLAPGDPAGAIMGDQYNPETSRALRELYGLDEPVVQQYFTWGRHVLRGDLGVSLINGTSVSDAIATRLPRTLYLMAGGVFVGLAIAVPVGIVAAMFAGRAIDRAFTAIVAALMSIPQFVIAFALIVVFAVNRRWLPATGYVAPGDDLVGFFESMVLPSITIGLGLAAFVARVLRSTLIDVMSQDYIRTATARGAGRLRVMFRHALQNAAIPTVTVVGLQIGQLLGGAIIVETVFAYPGMGRLMIESMANRDYPVVQASILLFTATFVVVNLATDVLYGVLDPRVRVRR